MKKTVFFPASWYQFPSFTYVLRGQKVKVFFENLFTGTYRSLVFKLKEWCKTPLVLNTLHVGTHFSPKIQASTLSARSQPQASFFWEITLLKKDWL